MDKEKISFVITEALKTLPPREAGTWSPKAVSYSEKGLKLFFAGDAPPLKLRIELENLVYSALSEADIEYSEDFEIDLRFDELEQNSAQMRLDQKSKETIGAFGTKLSRQAIPGVSKIVAIASGKGGVGKSTVSAFLAQQAAKAGLAVGLLDADLFGPSIPLLFGVQAERPRLTQVEGRNRLKPVLSRGVQLMSFGFLTDSHSPALWRGPLLAKALEDFFYEVHWGSLDILFIDLPPGTGDTQLTVIEKLPIHHALIVTTPQKLALADAVRAVSMFRKLDIPLLGFVENMGFHHCAACGHKNFPFSQEGKNFSEQYQLEQLASFPLDPSAQNLDDADWEADSWSHLLQKVQAAPLFFKPPTMSNTPGSPIG